MLETTYLTNNLLIAMPNLADPNFLKTVTYVCMHNEDGAMGIVINRPMDIDLDDVLEQMDIESSNSIQIPIFDGGPVQRERGFVLHQPDHQQWNAMLKVSEEVNITTSRDIIVDIANNKGPNEVLIALGYAGWGAGQLEQEMADNIWLNTLVDNQIIFNTPPNQRWKAAVESLGIDLNLLSAEAGHA
ncbi:YqgE/AlgH family protein [Candidatus Halobeggiatoa sp. HSG11]|nr:YqgE/AlgH family protein [Candidatus Halobeggiatoa sp. HSG11]